MTIALKYAALVAISSLTGMAIGYEVNMNTDASNTVAYADGNGIQGSPRKERKSSSLFAEHADQLYVQTRASGIPWLCFLTDGFRICRFPKDRFNYIAVDRAIAWHEKELDITQGRSGNRNTLKYLKQAANQFAKELQERVNATAQVAV